MRASRFVLCFRTLLCGASLCTASTSFAEDPYADYRIPAHNWHSWSFNVGAGGSHQLGQGEAFGRSTVGDVTGSLLSSYSGGYDSDPHAAAYGLSVSASGDRNHQSQSVTTSFASVDQTQLARGTHETVTGFLAVRRYPWSAPLGFSLGSNATLNLAQSWRSSSITAEAPPFTQLQASNVTTGTYNVQGAASASVGWGRTRDATPVYQVQVLEQRLLDLGTIQRPLSPAARERLASLYTMELRVAFAHQRPTKYFWGELERLLHDDGVLSEAGLDAYSVQRLLEPIAIAGRSVARVRGYFLGPQVALFTHQFHESTGGVLSQAQLQDGVILNSSEVTVPRSDRNLRDDDVMSGFTAEYHQPFGPRWQADGFSRTLVAESGERVDLSNTLLGTWLVSDRWYASVRFDQQSTAPGSGWDRHVEQWAVNSAASLSYFIEDSWALQLSASQQQFHDAAAYTRRETFSLGVTYQLSGLLNAPGRFEPMRLAPPAH